MPTLEKVRESQHSQFVRPSPLRAAPPAPGYRPMGANKPTNRYWLVTMDFEADDQHDSYTVKVFATTDEEARELAFNALVREYGGDIHAITYRFTPTGK